MFDIHQQVTDPESGEIDRDAFDEYADGLLAEFADSPEARPVVEQYGELTWAESMLDFALDYLGVTPPEMSAGDFREVVFEIIPRKVSTEAGSAGAIIAELRAFWQFLQRSYQLKNAGAILATLKGDAVARLERELADPANYGMAKSFFMMGQQMGFDMTTQEGLDAFTAYYNNQLAGGMLPDPLGGMIPGALDEIDFDDGFDADEGVSLPPEQTPKQRAQLRKKRKAQRQARKRNRRKK